MKKYKQLVRNLKNNVYCRIKPDSFGGVGVFAIKDIPEGVNPVKLSNGDCFNYKSIDVPEEVVNKLEKGVKKMVKDFYEKDHDNNTYGIPYEGINVNDITFYINTSKNPNLDIISSGKCDMYIFKTNKHIKKGQELLINYDNYSE